MLTYISHYEILIYVERGGKHIKTTLKPHTTIDRSKLRATRRAKEITTEELAKSIRLSRRQYELKEKGLYSFKDYEMLIISEKLDTPITELFF